MLGQHTVVSLLCAITTLWSVGCDAAPTKEPTDLKWVYRGDSRTPEEIQKIGGFLARGVKGWGVEGFPNAGRTAPSGSKKPAKGSNGATPDISLYNHVRGAGGDSRDDDGYVSTTSDVDVAERTAFNLGDVGYIYKIFAAENLIDASGTIGSDEMALPDEKEWAAIGGIKWEQVISWSKVDANGDSYYDAPENLNDKFNTNKFDAPGVKVGGVQYQLAGFPPNHKKWNQAPWKAYKPVCKRDVEDFSFEVEELDFEEQDAISARSPARFSGLKRPSSSKSKPKPKPKPADNDDAAAGKQTTTTPNTTPDQATSSSSSSSGGLSGALSGMLSDIPLAAGMALGSGAIPLPGSSSGGETADSEATTAATPAKDEAAKGAAAAGGKSAGKTAKGTGAAKGGAVAGGAAAAPAKGDASKSCNLKKNSHDAAMKYMRKIQKKVF